MLKIFTKVNAFALAHKALVSITTLGTVGLVLTQFSPELVGYYYAFQSALGLQILFEQGMSFTVLQVASREFSSQDAGTSTEVQQLRMRGLIRKICVWYFKTALYYGLFLLIAGTAYFYNFADSNHGFFWMKAWVLLVVAQSALLVLMPVLLLRESQGNLVEVWVCKIVSDALAFAVFAISVLAGLGLLSLSLGLATKVACICFYFFFREGYRRFILSALNTKVHIEQYWQQQFSLFQKKISYSWLAGYMAHHSISLVLFGKFDAVLAGAYGASWQVIQGISAIAMIPISTKVQLLAANEAKGAGSVNTQAYIKLFPAIIGLALVSNILFLGVIAVTQNLGHGLGGRFLPLIQLLQLSVISIVGVVITSQAILIRSQLIEPYIKLSFADCLVHFCCVGLAIFFNNFAVILAGLLAWQLLGALPWAYRIFSSNLKRY
jgi:hypothetical protein